MGKVIERHIQPISLEPIWETPGLKMTIHGEKPDEDTATFLSLQEARLLAYGLLAGAEKQGPSI
jgi:hypothetical protein